MNFNGRWITRNRTLVACHPREGATQGDIDKWRGHTIPGDSITRLEFIWNVNGECITVAGVGGVDINMQQWDLMEMVTGKDRAENSLKVEGCKECEND